MEEKLCVYDAPLRSPPKLHSPTSQSPRNKPPKGYWASRGAKAKKGRKPQGPDPEANPAYTQSAAQSSAHIHAAQPQTLQVATAFGNTSVDEPLHPLAEKPHTVSGMPPPLQHPDADSGRYRSQSVRSRPSQGHRERGKPKEHKTFAGARRTSHASKHALHGADYGRGEVAPTKKSQLACAPSEDGSVSSLQDLQHEYFGPNLWLSEAFHKVNCEVPSLFRREVLPCIQQRHNVVVSEVDACGNVAMATMIAAMQLVNWNDNWPQVLLLAATRELAQYMYQTLLRLDESGFGGVWMHLHVHL